MDKGLMREDLSLSGFVESNGDLCRSNVEANNGVVL